MKLGDFLKTLADKTDIKLDFGTLSNVKLEELNKIELDADIAEKLDTSLMSLTGAKTSPELLKHYKSILLKSADEKFAILAEKYGFADELLMEKSTYKKFDILESKFEEKIKSLQDKQSKTNNPEKEAELQKQITTLQGEMRKLTEANTTEVNTVRKSYEEQIADMYYDTILSSKKYATKDLPIDVNRQVAKTLIENELKKVGAIKVRENGVFKLKQAANPEMDYVDAGYRPVSFADFTDKTLAENKMLDVSNGNPPPARQQQSPAFNAGNPNQNTAKFEAAMAAAVGEQN